MKSWFLSILMYFQNKKYHNFERIETRATVFLKRTNFTSQINSEIYWPLEGSESWGEIGIKILERNCSIWIVFVSILFYQLLKVKTQRMCTINGSSNRPSRKVTNFKKLNWSWTYFEQKTLVTFAVSNLLKIYNYSKASRYTASSCTDLADARFWIGSKNIWAERIYVVKTLSSTVFWSSCLHPIK